MGNILNHPDTFNFFVGFVFAFFWTCESFSAMEAHSIRVEAHDIKVRLEQLQQISPEELLRSKKEVGEMLEILISKQEELIKIGLKLTELAEEAKRYGISLDISEESLALIDSVKIRDFRNEAPHLEFITPGEKMFNDLLQEIADLHVYTFKNVQWLINSIYSNLEYVYNTVYTHIENLSNFVNNLGMGPIFTPALCVLVYLTYIYFFAIKKYVVTISFIASTIFKILKFMIFEELGLGKLMLMVYTVRDIVSRIIYFMVKYYPYNTTHEIYKVFKKVLQVSINHFRSIP